jgi:hypothetical protein
MRVSQVALRLSRADSSGTLSSSLMPGRPCPAARSKKSRLAAARACGIVFALGALAAGAREARAGDEGGDPEELRALRDPWEQRARSKIEIGPWLGSAAGSRWGGGKDRDVASLSIGLDATSVVETVGNLNQYGGRYELRMGAWAAYDPLWEPGGVGEGGVLLLFTQTKHAQWGTFGVRVGAGHGGDHVSHLVITLLGGVRYVPDRSEQREPGRFATATGARIIASFRRTFGREDDGALIVGIELEPRFFLPPYSLFKLGGYHQ